MMWFNIEFVMLNMVPLEVLVLSNQPLELHLVYLLSSFIVVIC